MAEKSKTADKKKRSAERRANTVGLDPRRERRVGDAAAREKARAARSNDEQLALLGTRPGAARRERARLSGGDGQR
jgi:hypothetical protein